jgi:hypothetical protein
MHELLEKTIKAHGGLDAWRKVSQVSADFSAHGAGLRARGPIGDAIAQCKMRVAINTRRQQVSFAGFMAEDNTGLYDADGTEIRNADGDVAERLDDPRASLTNMAPGTPWSGPQLLYFFGYSLWMYITAPYNLLAPGVSCEEVEPWVEDGETWRALKVTYGGDFPSHSTEQIHYFDDAGLMRRQDYTVDVRQDIGVAHYMYGQHAVDGLIFPTQRRIYRAAADRTPLMDQLLISADFANYAIAREAA